MIKVYVAWVFWLNIFIWEISLFNPFVFKTLIPQETSFIKHVLTSRRIEIEMGITPPYGNHCFLFSDSRWHETVRWHWSVDGAGLSYLSLVQATQGLQQVTKVRANTVQVLQHTQLQLQQVTKVWANTVQVLQHTQLQLQQVKEHSTGPTTHTTSTSPS